ncbi:MAG TPA: DNA topoisomerase IV subunit B [Bacteroidales bacterium]|jgi:topoisomerase-4 subunit B|nr:DNA topoisomerase IV subunit B [Bacteroidales bacterium]HRS99067.1 DNA topoisomerase IV subunit B [Bacteroidales bacterium]HRT80664.1 DNA topoisomerase IV subunit B [Bacteroidales bacterium]HUM32278.1 DNA topoisomerase IV subunit B [Bacteroidales bacterium]
MENTEKIIGTYNEDSIQTLNWEEHIRRRPGMYIGKLGDGKSRDDGIYILIKEVIDNSVDEFAMGFGKSIDIKLENKTITIRDYGRGIPFGKLVDVASKMNTGAKYDSKVFQKSVGLNGVGIKAVNALSSYFKISTYRDGKKKTVEFKKGILISETELINTESSNGTLVIFTPDEEIFGNYNFVLEYIENMLRNYTYLNTGLNINFNGIRFHSRNGLLDLLQENLNEEPLYPPIHLKDTDFEIAITHGTQYSEEYFSFVNGQHTTQGGTHLAAFREAFVKTIRDFYKKDYDASDIRQSIIAAISIRIVEPIFESQTKTKLGSKDMEPGGISIRNYIFDFMKKLDDYLHKNPSVADVIQKKILASEKDRKAIAGIQKIAKERAKKVSLHNKKLRDCKIHYNSNDPRKSETTIFITEGDSASGSITKSRDVNTQAVFSLKGKPLNTYGMTKKVVYENEEFNLLQAALNIEEGIENLRYRNVVIATDADVDGMHIRLLLITFFLQFFPDLIRNGHLFILQTPLFRVRNKTETIYCYDEIEKEEAIKKLKNNVEITRFKGLGEISPNEFKEFIGKNIRLDPVTLTKYDQIPKLLEFYMGKNTPERQDFIISNLKVDEEI